MQKDIIVAIRVHFVDAYHVQESSEMIIRIPDGGRCEYSPEDRMFSIYDADNNMFRNVHAPGETTVDISYIEKEYLNLLDQANKESYRQHLN
jgi:hypothetical protein